MTDIRKQYYLPTLKVTANICRILPLTLIDSKDHILHRDLKTNFLRQFKTTSIVSSSAQHVKASQTKERWCKYKKNIATVFYAVRDEVIS